MSVPTPVTGPPDEGGTADRIAGLQSAADRGSDGSAPTVVDATHGESVHLPGANQPLHADFTRVGHDLHLELPNGETVVVVGFFSGGPGNLPTLWLEGGGRILGETAARLAGPETPARLAQDDGTATDAATGPAPVGAVDAVKGTATVIRADGTEEAIEPGTPIYENDTVVTTGDSALGVLFADNSTMSMGGNARIIIDEMVYDAATNTGSQVFDAVQGSFVFATGEIGHENPEDVQVRTPVATIGIRGTKYGVNVGADDGETTVTLFEGSVSVSNDGGETILDAAGQTTRVSSFTEPPSPRTTLDPQEQADLFGDAIAFSPNPPSSGRSGPGNNDPTDGDRSDLGPEGIEQLADQFAGLDTASGPDGAITDVTQSSAFLSLLDSPFESAASPSGALGDGLGGETGDDGLGGFDGPDGGVLGDDDGASGDDGTSIGGAGSDALTIGFSGTDSFLFNPANPFTASVTGSTAPGVVDRFTLDTTGFDADTTWNVGQTGDGDVVVTEAGGTEVTLDEVEELGFALGGGDDTVTVGDLSNTDIIQDTVFLRGGAGNDVLDASATDKTVVAAAGTGADTVIGGGGDDALSVVLDPEAGADTVIGGAGDDTLAVSLPVSAAALSSLDPATIEALVALADFVEGGHAATESRSFEALNLTVEGVESLTLYDSAGQAVPTDSVRNLDRVITGDETDETLTGGAGDDRIDGKAGDDIVSAGGGDDEIASNAGADRIDAGPGDDIVTLVYPDAAAETVHGGAGEDRLILEIDPAMTGIDAALADVAAAIKAAKTDPAAAQTVESLGLTFDGFEAVDLFVDDVLQQAAPTVAAAGSGSSAAPDALAEGVTVASAVTIDDADSPTLTQATVTLPAPAAGDSLAVDADSLAQSGLSAALSEGADGAVVLTLSGEAPLAVYQDALAAVRLVNAEPVPTSGARTVEIAVTDDDGITSEAASLSLTVAPPATLSEEPAANSDSALFLQAADADGVVASAVSRAPETEERTGRIDSSNFDEPGLGFAVGARVIQSDGTLSDAAVENVSVGHSNRGSAFGVKGLPEAGVAGQIGYAADRNLSEELVIDFDHAIDGATVGISNLYADEGVGGWQPDALFPPPPSGVAEGGEQGHWMAYRDGDLVAEADFQAPRHGNTADIEIALPDGVAADRLVFSATPYAGGQGGTGDSSDYWISGIDYRYTATLDGDEGPAHDDWLVGDGDGESPLDPTDLPEIYGAVDMGGGRDWAVAAEGTEGPLAIDLASAVWSGTENAVGGAGADVLRGDGAANILAGGGGDDTLIGDGADDLLLGGGGDDTFVLSGDDLGAPGDPGAEPLGGARPDGVESALAANDRQDGAAGLDRGRPGVDGGSGEDRLTLSDAPSDGRLDGDDVAGIMNIETLDVGTDGEATDVALSLDDVVAMTDDDNALTILKGADDSVSIDDAPLENGTHSFAVDNTLVKVTVADSEAAAAVPETG